MNDVFDDKLIEKKIHIRIQQRNAKKSITIIEGLDQKFDLTIIVRYLMNKFNCSGTVKNSFIQLTGDQRNNILDFLISEQISTKDNIIIHGY